MKNKTSITHKLGILFYALLVVVFSSCNPTHGKKEIERKYEVRISNWVGSDWYKCDSVIWVSESHLQLKNEQDKEPFMDIFIPKEVIVRVSLNGNEKLRSTLLKALF